MIHSSHSDIWRVSESISISVEWPARESGRGHASVSVACSHKHNSSTICRFLLSEKTSYPFKNYGAHSHNATSEWVERQSFHQPPDVNNNNNNKRSKVSKWHQLNSLVVERQEHHNVSLQPDIVANNDETFEEKRGFSLLSARRDGPVGDSRLPRTPIKKLFPDEETNVETRKHHQKSFLIPKHTLRSNNLFLGPKSTKRSGHASLGNFIRDSYQNENIR